MSHAEILAFHIYNAGIQRARQAYYDEPNACADWCVKCVQPRGSNGDCGRCRDLIRRRATSAVKRDAIAAVPFPAGLGYRRT